MFQTLKNAFKQKDIRRKIFLTLFLLLVYRIGCWLPIPGVVTEYYKVGDDSLLGLMSALAGGALSNGAFLALGVVPYINASIIIQLLAAAIPVLENWQKQGEEGARKLNKLTRFLAMILALVQSIFVVIGYTQQGAIDGKVIGDSNLTWLVATFVVIIMTGGAAFTMWLGEKITEVGIGNGVSLLIFVGILSTTVTMVTATITDIATYGYYARIWELIGFFVLVVLIFAFIIFVDLAERRISVQYAKQIKGRKMYGGQSSHIPIKVNAGGVMPIIFANAIITLPQVIMQWFFSETEAYQWYMEWLGVGTIVYSIATGLLILFFSYFYATLQFKPDEISRNIQQHGGFITGIRPGKPTADYLAKINNKLTFVGAVFLAFIAIVPSVIFRAVIFEILKGEMSDPSSALLNAFTATGMLIVVSVALEFQKQLEGQLMMKQYKGFLR